MPLRLACVQDNDYFDLLFGYEWKLGKGAGGAHQWYPTDKSLAQSVPDAHDPAKSHAPTMFTSDIALKMDPVYGPISKRFHANPDQFADAFARAWYKLTHRDMGPVSRYLGNLVPKEAQLWQDPLPVASGFPTDDADIASLKTQVLASGLSIAQLVSTAWGSAATFRTTDKRGGANGARIRLSPQKDWPVNQAAAPVLEKLEAIQAKFNAGGDKQVSLADLIVLAGTAAVEEAAKRAGNEVQVPFSPGRTDATQEQTDVNSFSVLEPTADGFRNYLADGHSRSGEELLVDRAQMLTLTAPEMAVLVAGMRALNANATDSDVGIFTERPETLTNDFFVNLLAMDMTWAGKDGSEKIFEAHVEGADNIRWTGSRVDLVFGSNSQLRAIAERYACSDSQPVFVKDFAAAWSKVMNLDRFDL